MIFTPGFPGVFIFFFYYLKSRAIIPYVVWTAPADNKILQRMRFMTYVWIFAVVVLLVVFVYRQSSGYNIVEYELTTSKDIPGPIRFVMLSDLHDTDVTHDDNKGLIEALEALSPDFVILAGDVITSYVNPSKDHHVSRDFLSNLASRFEVYYGFGNHEERYRKDDEEYPGRFAEFESFVKGLGIHILSDDHIHLSDKNISIYGFDIPLEYYKRFRRGGIAGGMITDKLGALLPERYNILIAHDPDFFDEYVSYGADLVLSGHLHGGMIVLPGIGGIISPQLQLFPKYDFGVFCKEDTTMIVSRGIGWHSIPLRIFNKAEIVTVTIGGQTEKKQEGI